MKYVEVDLGDLASAQVIPLSDLHVGDKHFNEEKYLEMIDYIASKDNVFVILVGDLVNNAIIGSVSDVYGEIKTPTQARKYVIDTLMPIKKKILGIVKGNHENRSKKAVDFDITEEIANALDIVYGGESLFLNVKIGGNKHGRFSYTMYITHGNGGGGTPGAKINALYKANRIILSDMYIMGHVHNMMTFPDTIFVP